MTTGLETMTSDGQAYQDWRIETGTRLSRAFSFVCLVAFAALAVAPLLLSRGVVQDLFFILTMLTLAQSWNLLAGYAGLRRTITGLVMVVIGAALVGLTIALGG